jgi:hypothetical protein
MTVHCLTDAAKSDLKKVCFKVLHFQKIIKKEITERPFINKSILPSNPDAA